MEFKMTTRTWVFDNCSDEYKLRYVDHPFTTDGNGAAVVMVGYAMSEPLPIVKVTATNKGENIEVGVCETYDPSGPDEIPCYAPRPVLISNTYNSYLTDEGLMSDGVDNQIEHVRLPPHTDGPYYERWTVYPYFRLNDDDPYARPWGPVIYPVLKSIRDTWIPDGHEDFFNFRACEYPGQSIMMFRDPVCGAQIITVGRDAAMMHFKEPSYPAHHAGHWFHTHLHGAALPATATENKVACWLIGYADAWKEGFADYFANKSGYIPWDYWQTGGEIYSNCPSPSNPEEAYQTAGFVADFLWDVFDSAVPGAFDDDMDHFQIARGMIYSWNGKQSFSIMNFILQGKQPGMPFSGSQDLVCPVQTLNHLDFDCP
jgi:hypothetical protein